MRKLASIFLYHIMVILMAIFTQTGAKAQCVADYPVLVGTTTSYEISFNANITDITWYVTPNGSIVGDRNRKAVDIKWNLTGNATVNIVYYESGVEKSQCWSVPVNNPLNGGTVSSSILAVAKNDVISYQLFKNATAASGGTGVSYGNTYAYQWEESTDGMNWTAISGAVGQDCSGSGMMDKKYYFRRKVSDEYAIAYSNIITVDITNKLLAGVIATSQAIQSGTVPSAFTALINPSGGTGSYTYQWESSADGSNWTSISGANSNGYQAPATNVTLYFRKKVTSGTQVSATNIIQVLVKSNQTVNKPAIDEIQGSNTKLAPPDYSAITSTTLNSVKTSRILKPGITNQSQISSLTSPRDISVSSVYMDGLDRVLESVLNNGGNNSADLVQFSQYDQFGRQPALHLPYLATTNATNKGTFRTDIKTAQPAFFNTLTQNKEDYFYGKLQDELSPETRFLKTELPGKSRTGSSVGAVSQTVTNDGSEHVRIWKVGASITNLPISTAEYEAGTLAVHIERNEHGVHVTTYVDLNGQTVMRAEEGIDGTYKNELRTYYIYDDIGNLRYVIPPLAIKGYWDKTTWDFATTDAQNKLKQLGYKFYYDAKGRVIIKEIAGMKGSCYYVYDNRDRLVLFQDHTLNNRKQGEWLLYLYDGLDRVAVMALYQNATATRESLQTQMDQVNGSSVISITTPLAKDLYVDRNDNRSQYVASESVTLLPGFETQTGQEQLMVTDATVVSVTDNITVTNPLPNLSGYKPLMVYYYDNYNWSEAASFDKNYTLNAGANAYSEPVSSPSKNIHGNLTGYKLLVPASGKWLKHTLFYDEKGRVVQMASTNIQGGTNVRTVLYDYNSKILSSYARISNPQSTTEPLLIVQKRMEYDQTSKIVKAYYAIGNGTAGTEKLLSQFTYDDLNRLKVHTIGNGIETTTYDYDLYGRIKGINGAYTKDKSANNYFGMELSFENGFTEKRKDGFISGVTWRRKGYPDAANAYGFSYDNLDRLTKADYTQNSSGNWENNKEDYTMSSEYDDGGNIVRMKEEGMLPGKVKTTIDDLSYEYKSGSNQLIRVTDPQGDKKQGDFKNYSGRGTGDDYSYDDNGYLTGDKNKGISITYDYLIGKPDKISQTNSTQKYITFTRDVSGNLLQRTVSDDNELHTYTFLEGAVYKDNVLQYVGFNGGRVRKNAKGEFVFDYFLKDNLGNTRTVITEEVNQLAYKATHEDNPSPVPPAPERELFSFPENVDAIPQGHKFYDYNGKTNRKFVKLNYTDPSRRIGTGKVLRVMSGDQLNLGVLSYYQTNSTANNTANNPADEIVNQLIKVLLGPVSTIDNGKGNILQGANGLLLNQEDFNQFVQQEQTDNPPSTVPRAYLNYVLFDDNFQMVSGNAIRVSQPGDVSALAGQISVGKNGYLYVYVSNESNSDVYFDDLAIQHNTGPLLQENSYYPYGLQIAGLSGAALNRMQNNFQYNGIEKISEFELELYDAFYRTLDPQLGRWLQIDPVAAKYASLSGYNAMMNNPVNYADPLGDDPPGWLVELWRLQEAHTRANLKGYVLDPVTVVGHAPISFNNLGYVVDGAMMQFTTNGYDEIPMQVLSRNTANTFKNTAIQLHTIPLIKPGLPANPNTDISIDNQHPMFVQSDPCVGCQEVYRQKYWARESLRRMYETPNGQSFMIVGGAADAFTWEYGTYKAMQAAGYALSSMGITGKITREMAIVHTFENAERAAAAGVKGEEMARVILEEAAKLEHLGYAEKVGEYTIYGTKGIVGNTFRRRIFLIDLPKNLRGSRKLFKWLIESLSQEAKAAGATKLEVFGYSTYNEGFFSQAAAQYYGFTAATTGVKGEVVITKILVP